MTLDEIPFIDLRIKHKGLAAYEEWPWYWQEIADIAVWANSDRTAYVIADRPTTGKYEWWGRGDIASLCPLAAQCVLNHLLSKVTTQPSHDKEHHQCSSSSAPSSHSPR